MKLTEGERLIAVMLADIKEKLDARGEIDPDFVKSAIFGRHDWAFNWEYEHLCDPNNQNPPEVEEVTDTLETWRFLHNSYKELSPEDRDRVKEHVFIEGDKLTFPGFDGNHETEHYSIAVFMVEKLRRFTELNHRALNSHAPSVDGYRRMNRAFAPIRNNLGMGRDNLTADDMIEVLKARRA